MHADARESGAQLAHQGIDSEKAESMRWVRYEKRFWREIELVAELQKTSQLAA